MVSRKYCGGGIAILGVIVAVCGIVLYFLITHFQNVGIAGNKVLTRTSAAFSSWSSNENTTSQPPLYYSVYMFNMTNQDQVTQAGSKPIYEKKGPYVYREYQVRFDAEFIENDNAVSFYESKYYVFDREQTDPSLNPDTDVFINVNPGYMGIMQQTKQDLAVVVMFLNVILGYNIDLLKYSFVPDYLVNLSINGTSSSAYNLISQTSSSYFYDTWANNTNTNLPANWVDMTLSPGGLPSNISLSSAQKIFSADGYGLGNVSFPAARVWSNAMVNSTGKSLLMNEFGITEAQIDLVFSWLSRFAQNVVVPPLLTQYSIVDVTDLAWVQFALCNFFPGGVATFYNTHKIEACHVFGNNVTLAKDVVNGTHGLLQVSNTLEFFETYLSSGGAAKVAKMWDLNIATVYGMFGYLFSLTPYAKQYATDFINTNGGGIIVNRTVNEWLWNATDPLLEHIGQNSPVNLFTNDTSLDFVRNTTVRSIQYTGNNDTSLAQTYAQWNGTKTLSNIWNRPPAINGSEGFAFPSDLTETSQLWIFDDTTFRSGNLVYNQTVVNQGISLYRFYIDPKMLMPNPIYDQTIAGFANMTSVYQTPIFLCKPDFYQVAPGYANKVVISPAPTPGVNDEIYLDVEPQTGLTMTAWKQLQANIYVDPGFQFTAFNPKFPTDTFFPIASAIEHSNITESLANTFKSQVYGSAKLKKGLLWGLLGFGVVLLLVGCMLVIFGEDKSYEQLY